MDQYRVIGTDGKEFGPVDLAGMQQWIREGRVVKQSRVRKNDGPAVAAESLPELAETFAPPALPVQPATPPIATAVPLPNEFRSWAFIGQAWDLFKPHWLQLSAMFLLLSLFGAIPYIGPCISFFIGTTLIVGINRAVLGLLAGQPPKVEMMFNGFDRFGQAFLAGVVIAILMSVVVVPILVPIGVVVSTWPEWSSPGQIILLSAGVALFAAIATFLGIIWSFTYLVLAETNQDFWTAMQTSVALTRGYRWSLFCLLLALMVIVILGLLICCIGVVVAQALASVTYALVYRFLQSKRPLLAEV